VGLLRRRAISESAWRELLLRLIDRGLVAPSASMLLWCRRFPEDGFVASRPFALGTLPPFCPSCGDEAHAIASFMPDGGLLDAMNLKDGLLGAAIGWHLTRRGTRSGCEKCVMANATPPTSAIRKYPPTQPRHGSAGTSTPAPSARIPIRTPAVAATVGWYAKRQPRDWAASYAGRRAASVRMEEIPSFIYLVAPFCGAFRMHR